MSDSINLSIDGQVATITLNRPKKYNAFNREMALALQDTLDRCKESDVRAVMITGEGKAFCAGQDLAEVTDPEKNPGFKAILDEHYNPIIQRIRVLEKPVVAAINGVAAGAGANIALACDITIAAESTNFIQAFSKIGLIPDSAGTFFLPRLIGFQRAMALAMLGDKVSAKDAENMGMIYKCVADAEFTAFAKAITKNLAKMPTKALAKTKQAMNASLQNTLDDQLKLESKLQIESAQTEDYKEGVNAFMEKRKPEFTGK